MANQQMENEKPEADFLEDIRHRIMLNEESKKWSVETKFDNSHMSLIITSSEKFSEEHIHLIVQIISDSELFRFEKLWKSSWCSGYDLSGCRPKYLEFNWINLGGIRAEGSKGKKLINETCSCAICSFKFEN